MGRKVEMCSVCQDAEVRYKADKLCANCYQSKMRWSKRQPKEVALRIAKLALYSLRMELISNVTDIKAAGRRRRRRVA